MKKLLFAAMLISALQSHAQVFWTETFSNGCTSGCLANSYSGPNGSWTVISTGANAASSNKWFVSGAECGNAAGQCGTPCAGTDPSLHVGADIIIVIDPGAAYYNAAASNWRTESPVINCTGKSNISVGFNYIMDGEPNGDFAALAYYDGSSWFYYSGTVWTATFSSLPVTNNSSCAPQGLWSAYSVMLPASANNNANVKIGFQWTNDTDANATDPSFAVDDINISSAGGCSVTINPIFPAILCYGDCNSALSATASGTGSIAYSWNTIPVQTTQTITNLCAGTYTVTITDSAGCTATASMTITQPPLLNVAIFGNNFNGWGEPCNGDCLNTLTVSIAGGTPPYSFLWSNGCTTQVCPNNCAGVYTVTATDANGCTASASYTVTEPPLLTVSITDLDFNGWDEPCNGDCLDTLFANPSGGTPPYSYLWSNGCTTQVCPNNCAGVYTITVTDVNGCTASASFTVTEPPLLVVNITDVDFNGWDEPCHGDCVDTLIANASGGTPLYSFQWSTGNTTPVLTGICVGTYTVTVWDANGCTATASFTVTEPPLLTMGAPIITNPSCVGCTDGSICAGAPSGGTPPYSYQWTPPVSSTNCANNIGAGIYTVCVVDANGCTTCVTDTLKDPVGIADIFSPAEIILSPNIISTSAVLTVPFAEQEFSFAVYDSFGKMVREKIFSGKQILVERENLSSGLYFFKLTANQRRFYTGKFMIE